MLTWIRSAKCLVLVWCSISLPQSIRTMYEHLGMASKSRHESGHGVNRAGIDLELSLPALGCRGC